MSKKKGLAPNANSVHGKNDEAVKKSKKISLKKSSKVRKSAHGEVEHFEESTPSGKSESPIVVKALYGSQDRPVKIGDVEIQCYVLEDETRVLVQRGLLSALGMSTGGASGAKIGSSKLSVFLQYAVFADIVTLELIQKAENPILFQPPHGGRLAYGYEATILADICDLILEARKRGLFKGNQERMRVANRCEQLIRGFARVGILALVDEATGYQEIRDKQALQKILEKYISPDKLPYVKMFPEEFYQEMFRVMGWQWKGMKVPKPSYVGTLTDDWVYRRLAPGIHQALRLLTPRNEKGRLKYPKTRHLTEEEGKQALRQHLHTVTAIMKLAPNKRKCESMLNRVLPRFGDTIPLPLDDEMRNE